ncbi:MAG: RNB domain-containing ribonuclease [Treponema sp.]|jgi:exoribonuclease-2|nr:RNB domain-containing ribonuclease [Treponema sp.]
MFKEKSLVLYKNRPALVVDTVGEKIGITVLGGEQLKVREKDVELLHPGPVQSFSELENEGIISETDIRGAWELLSDNRAAIRLQELSELVYGEYSPRTAWAACRLLADGLYFNGTIRTIKPRPADELAVEEKRRAEKQRDIRARDAFLERLKEKKLILPDDRRFLQDAEALAYGQTDKSRTLRDMGLSETPEEAHRLLLSAGVWNVSVNPHPARQGLAVSSARIVPETPPDEDRVDLSNLCSLAIDNSWSDDPDDAVSLEEAGPLHILWVHVADPASSVIPGSPADLEARSRGATLYLPEGASRMLAEESLALFALGFTEISPALSFKITLKPDLSIAETEIIRSWVKVTRLSYEAADRLAGIQDDPGAPSDQDSSGAIPGLDGLGRAEIERISLMLRRLFSWAQQNEERRLNSGAVVSIELPEIHISFADGGVAIHPITQYRSSAVVRECMVLAGEGAAKWALARRLPFPFISQEAGEIPDDILPGMAGSYQLRRSMRPRALSIKPGIHWGLGLDEYTQVTSPLRRYIDLLAHQQIRAFLRGIQPLAGEEVLLRLNAADNAASAAVRAERSSRAYWTAVYLSDKIESVWDGIVLDTKGRDHAVIIPALGLETKLPIRRKVEPNDRVKLVLKSVQIHRGSASFVCQD